MVARDFDEAVRLKAYEIWMREGCPSGREHEHWAKAAAEVETETAPTPEVESGPVEAQAEVEPLYVVQPWRGSFTGRAEVERLRRALWEPQPYAA